MPDEVREHMTRDQRPFLYPESLQILQIHSSTTVHLLFSSVHSLVFYRVQVRGLAIAEAWFCAQWPIFVLFFRFVFGLLYGWKIQTWPIMRFLTEPVTYWFFVQNQERARESIWVRIRERARERAFECVYEREWERERQRQRERDRERETEREREREREGETERERQRERERERERETDRPDVTSATL